MRWCDTSAGAHRIVVKDMVVAAHVFDRRDALGRGGVRKHHLACGGKRELEVGTCDVRRCGCAEAAHCRRDTTITTICIYTTILPITTILVCFYIYTILLCIIMCYYVVSCIYTTILLLLLYYYVSILYYYVLLLSYIYHNTTNTNMCILLHVHAWPGRLVARSLVRPGRRGARRWRASDEGLAAGSGWASAICTICIYYARILYIIQSSMRRYHVHAIPLPHGHPHTPSSTPPFGLARVPARPLSVEVADAPEALDHLRCEWEWAV